MDDINYEELVVYIQQNLDGIRVNISDDLVETILYLNAKFLNDSRTIDYFEGGK